MKINVAVVYAPIKSISEIMYMITEDDSNCTMPVMVLSFPNRVLMMAVLLWRLLTYSKDKNCIIIIKIDIGTKIERAHSEIFGFTVKLYNFTIEVSAIIATTKEKHSSEKKVSCLKRDFIFSIFIVN